MYVFVYGTLLSSLRNNYLLNDSKFIQEETVGGLIMHDLGPFPACTVAEPQYEVKGEVWEIDERTLALLDRLEGYPSFYDRIQINTTIGQAWVYINENAHDEPVVSSGDWKAHNGWSHT